MANCEPRGGTAISLIIIHTNEGDNKPDDVGNDHTAEDLAAYCNRECAAGRGKSYHKIVDDDSTVQMVPDELAAWSALAANRRGLQLCLTGWAWWSTGEWGRHRPMLERARLIVQAWSVQHGIPLIHLTPAGVKSGLRGVIGHGDWSAAKMGDDSTHTDPGVNFPWQALLGSAAMEEPVIVQLPSTFDLGKSPERPTANWPMVEPTIETGARDVRVRFGFRGAWVHEAWFGANGKPAVHVVKPDKPIYVEQFNGRMWGCPAGYEHFVIRYSAPSGGSIGIL